MPVVSSAPLPWRSSARPETARPAGAVGTHLHRGTIVMVCLEGSVRYASNDVWFDLTRISMQAVMAANAGAR